MSSYSRSNKNGGTVSLNTIALSGGVALVLGVFLIDQLIKVALLG